MKTQAEQKERMNLNVHLTDLDTSKIKMEQIQETRIFKQHQHKEKQNRTGIEFTYLDSVQ